MFEVKGNEKKRKWKEKESLFEVKKGGKYKLKRKEEIHRKIFCFVLSKEKGKFSMKSGNYMVRKSEMGRKRLQCV